MATGVVIRLQNLPLTAGTIDIRKFFGGLSVPDGGVHIIGGEDGTAFILFTTDEDARQAMMRDGQLLFTDKIKLRLSSHTEMRKLIEDSQRRYEELRGLRPPEPPITNLSSSSSATGRVQTSPKSTRQEFVSESSDVYVELKNLPYTLNEDDFVYFFNPIPLPAVRIMRDDKGRFNGSGFAKFKCTEDKVEALKRDRGAMGSRYVRVFSTTERMWLLAGSQPCDTFRPGQALEANRKRTQERTPTNEGTPKRSRALSPLRYDNCVELRGLPPNADYKTIIDFFLHFQIAEDGIFVELDGKHCKGHAYVEFMNDHDYKAALLRDGEIIDGKQIRVIGISRQAMIEQRKLFEKYIKVKRDEEIRREYEERKQNEMKRMEEEKRRKHEEEIARKRLKKQREMEEWLSRQHAKEEEERKRLELEKRILAQEKSREEEKMRKAIQEENENRRKMEQAAKLNMENEQMKQRQMYEKQIKERKDESMPMDLEDQETSAPSIVTSVPYSLNNSGAPNIQPPPTSMIQTSYGMITPGSSGAPITGHYLPPPPLPPVSIQNTTPMQNRPPPINTPNQPPPDMLPPRSASFRPLPPTVPPPRVAGPMVVPVGMPSLPPPTPVMLNVNPPLPQMPPPPSMDHNHFSKNIRPQEPNMNGNKADNKFSLESYARIANSPWTTTDGDVRQFFSGLNIVPHGVKFVSNKSGRRSGHIFVKFATIEESEKAMSHDKTKLGAREVLVQKTNFQQMEEISRKCSNDSVYDILGIPPNTGARNGSHQTGNFPMEKALELKILQDKLTCIRIGNAPENVNVDSILDLLRGISIVPGGIQILHNSIGKCSGDIYVELVTAEDCVRASSFHRSVKLGKEIRILPISLNEMKRDLSDYFDRLRKESMRVSPRMFEMKPRPPIPDGPRMLNPPFLSDRLGEHSSRPMDRDRRMDDMRLRMPMEPRISPPLHHDQLFKRELEMQLHADRMRMGNMSRDFPPFPGDMLRPPLPDDRMFPRAPGPWDMPTRHPMNPGGFPFGGPMKQPQPVPIKMSNLSFKIQPDEILDFFNRYNPIPQSVRLLYHKDGKLNGDGVVFVPNIEAADAAIKDLNGKSLLQRKIRLQLG